MTTTRIKGLSERRRLPRLGKIHLGVKATAQSGKEYPKAVDFFVVPDEVKAVYGEKPRDLDIILPTDDPEQFFPQAYKAYKAGVGLWCSGDGEVAFRVSQQPGVMDEIECPCEMLDNGGCRRMGNLQVIIPKVSLGGVYQIDTSSINSIININSGIEFVQNRVGHLVNVPCRLSLRPQEVTAAGKKKVVHVMSLALANFAEIKALSSDMAEIKKLLAGQPALPPASPETDLIPAEVVETIPHEASEEAPAGKADDFNPPRKPAPAAKAAEAPHDPNNPNHCENWETGPAGKDPRPKPKSSPPPTTRKPGPAPAAEAEQGSILESF